MFLSPPHDFHDIRLNPVVLWSLRPPCHYLRQWIFHPSTPNDRGSKQSHHCPPLVTWQLSYWISANSTFSPRFALACCHELESNIGGKGNMR